MARGRVDLQPSITINANGAQEVRFAGLVPGGAKSGLLVVTITSTSATGGTLGIYTSPDPTADAGSWATVTGSLAPTTTGVKIATLGPMADYIRWYLSGMSSASFTCSMVVYTFDA